MSKNHLDAGTFDIPIERRQVYLPEFLRYSGPSRCHQAGRGACDAPRWRVPSRQKEHNRHSTAYAHQLKNGECGRYGCQSRVICCRISIPPCIRPKKQRTFGSQVPTAASGKNRNSLNIRRADRSYPCGFCGGSLCANSGHSLSTTARISSEIWSMCSISSDPVDALV